MKTSLSIACFGSSLLSAYWNGALKEFLEDFLPRNVHEDHLLAFWDVDAPATLYRLKNNPHIPEEQRLDIAARARAREPLQHVAALTCNRTAVSSADAAADIPEQVQEPGEAIP